MLLCGMMATQIVIALIKSRVFEAMGKEQKTAAEIAINGMFLERMNVIIQKPPLKYRPNF